MKKFKSVFKVMLIIIWMIIVFLFSNENGEKSENTSRSFTLGVIKTISKEKINENSIVIDNTDRIIRKVAHFTLYTIGGILIINYIYTLKKGTKEKVVISTAIGTIYAVTDELHQFFVSSRSAQILDVGIDTLGIITGIEIYLLLSDFMYEKHTKK